MSFEAGVVSNNPFKINKTPAVGATPAMGTTPAVGAMPAQFALGDSGSTDVKGFVVFRWRDRKAWDCASVPIGGADGSTCESGWSLRAPDFDGRFGATFAGSSSSTSASTVAGTGDVFGEANISLPLIMWQQKYALTGGKPAFLSLGPGFVYDGNTDRSFQDTHTSYALGLALNGGVPWTVSPSHALEVSVRWGFADVEIPALVTGTQNPIVVQSNSIGEPRFRHVWATNLGVDVQAPLSDSGGYLTVGGAFYGNSPFGSSLPVKPWTFRLGLAVPFSRVTTLFTDAASAFNPAATTAK